MFSGWKKTTTVYGYDIVNDIVDDIVDDILVDYIMFYLGDVWPRFLENSRNMSGLAIVFCPKFPII